MDHTIILFDGVCNFCNRTVNFIIDHDPDSFFRFAALQSESGQELLQKYGISQTNPDTLILIEEGEIFSRSTAMLRIVRRLSGWYSLLYDFIVIPAAVRDLLYDLFTQYRYTLFGKRAECRVPTKEERARFI
jgi:predicted DCC family thiol-disulfide oxidoreductase YuxK